MIHGKCAAVSQKTFELTVWWSSLNLCTGIVFGKSALVSYGDIMSSKVWVWFKSRVRLGLDLRLMLHDEGTMEEHCADSDRRHVKVPQVFSASKIINSL